MKIIIDIPEKTNARIRSDYETGLKGFRHEDMEIVCDAIYNGRSCEEITGFATSRVTNDMLERFGEGILGRVKQEVIQHIGANLYQEGAITIERIEDRAEQETVLIGRVSVLKKVVTRNENSN